MAKFLAKKETGLERRLRDLEGESRSLQDEIRSLTKALDKKDFSAVPLPPPPAPRPGTARGPAGRPGAAPRGGIGEQAAFLRTTDRRDPADSDGGGETSRDVRSMAAAESTPVHEAAGDEVPESGITPPSHASRPRRGFEKNERFASYLASGSFGKARPLSKERKLQRNKAIFMLIVVLLLAFVLYKALF
jgi:hypothetical protein